MPIYLILCFTFSKIALNIFINSLISGISISLFFVALQEDAANCVVIEDSANGVRAAKEAGMKCIGFKNANSGDQDLSSAEMVIDDFRKVNLDIFESLYN